MQGVLAAAGIRFGLRSPGMRDERGPRAAIEPQARVEPVAQALGVFEGERDERGGDVARDAGEDDADGLGLARGLVAGQKAKTGRSGRVCRSDMGVSR